MYFSLDFAGHGCSAMESERRLPLGVSRDDALSSAAPACAHVHGVHRELVSGGPVKHADAGFVCIFKGMPSATFPCMSLNVIFIGELPIGP